MNPIVPPSMPALPAAWIGSGVLGSGVLGYGTPLSVACCGLAIVAVRSRVWRLR